MSTIKIDKPKLDRATPEQNLAILDRWVAETADKLNTFIIQTNRKLNEERTDDGRK